MRSKNGITRRRTLQLVGTAAGIGTAGLAADEDEDVIRINVGYAGPAGRRAAESRASAVYYRFAFDAVSIAVPREAAGALAKRGDIRYVEDDIEMRALGQTLPWGIDRTDADVAHDNGETGESADIAVIDTGIDHDHPDLAANVGAGKAFVTSVEVTGPTWEDDNGHGTHCAGIADAVNDDTGVVGVSTRATLHAVKVLSAAGTGSTSDVAKGIEYTADQNWDVGSLSLGGGASSTLKDACEYAYSRNVALVAAAGNDGECTDYVTYLPCRVRGVYRRLGDERARRTREFLFAGTGDRTRRTR
jgi:subtilisin